MKKRIITFCMLLICIFGCSACARKVTEKEYAVPWETQDVEVVESSSYMDVSEWEESSQTPYVLEEVVDPGLQMNVDSFTGELSINRQSLEGTGILGDEGVWTIFVYMCGSTLESDDGLGTEDLIEMQSVKSSQNVRFVVQTGGTSYWNNNVVKSDCMQRLLIQNEEVITLEEQPLAGMGRSETLADFLQWGVKNFASERMGLVMWNHGGGSITGVCFDENDNFDSLDLIELDEALGYCCGYMNRKFDLIGFDACLMGTVEVANILASYGEYMCASQELEPGSGWDYQAIGDYLTDCPEADGAMLGKVVCDSFMEASYMTYKGEMCTLSLVDLSRMDALLVAFNEFARNMYVMGEDARVRAEIIRKIAQADNFGGNNDAEGYTNMVDMGGIVRACEAYVEGADAVLAALADAVVYSVSGALHRDAMGLSMYYPLCIQGSNELTVFSSVCISPYYLSFVDRLNQSGVTGTESYDYDIEQWFDLDGAWSWGLEEWFYEYWDYVNGYEETGESPYITFEYPPQFDEEGNYWLMLDEYGYYNTADVCAYVYEVSDDGYDLIELGQTYDVYTDWENGIIADYFDGYWLSLPDGQNLATYIVEATDDYLIYTSPIYLNGELTNLRMRRNYGDGYAIMEGTWDGIDEYGAAAREITELEIGDVIVPYYYAFPVVGEEEYYYYGEEYVVTGDMDILYHLMCSGDYLYAICIDDIYGDYYLTDYVMFNLDGEDIGFYRSWSVY